MPLSDKPTLFLAKDGNIQTGRDELQTSGFLPTALGECPFFVWFWMPVCS